MTNLFLRANTMYVEQSGAAKAITFPAGGGTLQTTTFSSHNISGIEPYLTLKNTTSENTEGGCKSKIIFQDHDSDPLGEIQVSHDGTGDDTKGDMIFRTNSGSGLQEALIIDSSGNVGIGTNSPSVGASGMLEVYDNISTNVSPYKTNAIISLRKKESSNVVAAGGVDIGILKFQTTPGGIIANLCEIVAVGDTVGSAGGGNASGQSGRLEFRTLQNGSGSNSSDFEPVTRMTIDSNGSVGIGTNTPSYKLDVTGSINATGTVSAGGSVLTSDDRTKHNETDISNCLITIKKLRPTKYFKTVEIYDVSHNFNLDSSGNPLDESGNIITSGIKTETGFIAQRVKEIEELQHLVNGENKKVLSLNYIGIIPYNTKAIQELDEIQQSEKTKLAAAEAKIATLEARLSALENQ